MNDDAEVEFEVGQKEGGTLWTVAVSCKESLSELEFAAALRSLADDILAGDVSFDSSPDVTEHDHH